MKKILQFLLFKSKLLLCLSIAFFLSSLVVRRQRTESSLSIHSNANNNLQELDRYGQLIDRSQFISTHEDTKQFDPSVTLDSVPFSCRVYTGLYSHFHPEHHGSNSIDSTTSSSILSTRFQEQFSMARAKSSTSNIRFEFVPMDLKQQITFLEKYGTICDHYGDKNENRVLRRYQTLISQEHTKPLAQELWKFCALNMFHYDNNDVNHDSGSKQSHGFDMIVYMDIDSPILNDLDFILEEYSEENKDTITAMKNFAVIGDPLSKLSSTYRDNDENDKIIHGSFLLLHKNNQYKNIVQEMIQTILSDDDDRDDEIIYNPLYIPKKLFRLIHKSRDEYNDEWVFLKQQCHSNPFETHVLEQERRALQSMTSSGTNIGNEPDIEIAKAQPPTLLAYPVENVINCPRNRLYCCDIIKLSSNKVVMMTRNILLPYQLIPQHPMMRDEQKLITTMTPNRQYEDPFITTIKEEVTGVAQHKPKNFHQLVLEKNCLPTSPICEYCVTHAVKFGGGSCKGCGRYCGCYCDMLCRVDVEEKPVRKILTAVLPKYRRDPTRLIPRIIHQTWFEPITREK